MQWLDRPASRELLVSWEMGECGSLDLGRRPFRRDSIGLAVSDGVGVVLVAWPCGWRASGGLGLQHAALVAGDARSACCSSSHVLVCSLPSGLVSRWRARQPSSRLQWELVAGIRTGRNPWLASAGRAAAAAAARGCRSSSWRRRSCLLHLFRAQSLKGENPNCGGRRRRSASFPS